MKINILEFLIFRTYIKYIPKFNKPHFMKNQSIHTFKLG